MVEEIWKMKNEILAQAKKELEERGPERMDVDRLGAMVDMVKDLAEAEMACWKAQYYRNAVTEAMENKYGYGGSPANGGTMTRQSERQGYTSSMGRDDLIGQLEREYKNMMPEERMKLKTTIMSTLR